MTTSLYGHQTENCPEACGSAAPPVARRAPLMHEQTARASAGNDMDAAPANAFVQLYWLPLGAGGRSVRWNGLVYERFAAWHEHRPAGDLYHSALEVRTDTKRYVIEMGPVWNVDVPDRGAVGQGPVGARSLGRFRWFRYEIRCWCDGQIPDVTEAVSSPVIVSRDPDRATAILDQVRRVPALTWGRDELGTGEMWNSNSLIAWLLASTDHDMGAIQPPPNGRAPGWKAGLALADRHVPRPTVTTSPLL